MIDGTRLDADACCLVACFAGSGVSCICTSGVGPASGDPRIIDRCDWKSTSLLHDPTLTLSFRLALRNVPICIEFRKCGRNLTSAPARSLIATKLVEIEFAGQEDI
jgi:hypothetical protein